MTITRTIPTTREIVDMPVNRRCATCGEIIYREIHMGALFDFYWGEYCRNPTCDKFKPQGVRHSGKVYPA